VIAAGRLDRRLVLEAPAETDDGAGGVTRSYETVTTLWAQVTPMRARSDIASDSLAALVTHRVVIRPVAGIRRRTDVHGGVAGWSFRDAAEQRTRNPEADEEYLDSGFTRFARAPE
jgi:head-tail adaptor